MPAPRSSQLKLLAGAVKRKGEVVVKRRSEGEEEKKVKLDGVAATSPVAGAGAVVVQRSNSLLGLGVYGSDSDSE